MAQALDVKTRHDDVAELIRHLASRVDDENIVLAGGKDIPAGEWVRFSVKLRDGTPVFEGVGRCATTVDNGYGAPTEERYEILLDQLQLDGRNEVLYERILLARSSLESGEPQSAQIELPSEDHSDTQPPLRNEPSQPPPLPKTGPRRPQLAPPPPTHTPRMQSSAPKAMSGAASSQAPTTSSGGTTTPRTSPGTTQSPGAAPQTSVGARSAGSQTGTAPPRAAPSRPPAPASTKQQLSRETVVSAPPAAKPTPEPASPARPPDPELELMSPSEEVALLPLTPDVLDRAQSLVPKIGESPGGSAVVTRTDVIKLAVNVGLAALEAQYRTD